METSYMLARIFGVVMVVIYGGLLLNQRYYHRIWQDLQKQPLLLFISGFIALILGLIVIHVHSVWSLDWRGIITFLGWLMIFNGVMRIVCPEIVLKIAEKVAKNQLIINITSTIMFLIGLYISFVGFYGDKQ